MKKFTLLFSLLFIAVLVNGQTNKSLALRIQEIQEKYSMISQHTGYLKKHQMMGTSRDAILKSAAATLTLDSVIYLTYDTETSDWVNFTKDEYTYTPQLQNTEWIEKSWNITLSTWEDETRIALGYDDEGRISDMIIWAAEETGGELVEESKLAAYYSNEGILDSIRHYYADTEGNWEVGVRQIYYYNEAGQLTRMDMVSLVEDEEGEYLEVLRFEYTYNDDGSMEKSSMFFIDEEFEMLFSETEYFYDEQGVRTASQLSMLDFMTFETYLYSRTEYEYNASNDVTEEITYLTDETTSEWVADQRSVYEYRDVNFTEVVFPSYVNLFGINEETNEFNKALDEINSFEMLDGNWAPTDKSVFYYSDETSTSAPEKQLAELMVYPNPASDHVFVKWDGFRQLSLEVYQVTGAKTMEVLVSPGQKISVSNLQRGIYIYKLLNDSRVVQSGKLIKK